MPYRNRADVLACKRRFYVRHYVRERERIDVSKRKLEDWFDSFKATQHCSLCPETHPACLDFHHRDPVTKEFDISQAVHRRRMSATRILKEIDKCDVVCANCQRKAHWKAKDVAA